MALGSPVMLLLASAAVSEGCPESPESESELEKRSGAGRRGVQWADPNRVREPSPQLSVGWALAQLVPSPELAVTDRGALFGMKWQLTPVLYSFALDRRLDPWRWFVVEPIVRHSGSIELFVSPEYLAGHGLGFGGRAGLRSYFGLIQRGDYLSVSLGTSYYRFDGRHGASYEAGAYVLFGMLGLEVGYLPGIDAVITTLRLRYF